jgi:hypothetical protein
MTDEVEWIVGPRVFSDLHDIISKHASKKLLYPDDESAALEIIEKYKLRKGVPLRIKVNYKMHGCLSPNYGEEK